MDFLRTVSWKRLLGWWLVMSIVVYVLQFALLMVIAKTGVSLIQPLNQAIAPIAFGMFGFIYFRGAQNFDWEHQLFATSLWLFLSMMLLTGLAIYSLGQEWPVVWSSDSLLAQVPSVAFMILAGMLARPNTKPPLPEGLEV